MAATAGTAAPYVEALPDQLFISLLSKPAASSPR